MEMPPPEFNSVIKENTRAKLVTARSSDIPNKNEVPKCKKRMCSDHRALVCVDCYSDKSHKYIILVSFFFIKKICCLIKIINIYRIFTLYIFLFPSKIIHFQHWMKIDL